MPLIFSMVQPYFSIRYIRVITTNVIEIYFHMQAKSKYSINDCLPCSPD